MSRMPLLRPTLVPGLARSWRGPRTLQLGADPNRAVLIDLPDPRGVAVLDLLDGSRSERAVLTRSSEHGLSAADARELIDTLQAAGFVVPAHTVRPPEPWLSGEVAALAVGGIPPAAALRSPVPPVSSAPPSLTPAQVLRQRAASRVSISGRGRLGAPVAVALAEAGVGHIHPDLPGAVTAAELPGGPLRGADIGQARAEAVGSALIRASPQIETRAVRRGAAALVIQLGYDQPVALLATAHLRRRQPHLALAMREGVAAIGPLVPATGRPCLNCLDLHRHERDPDRAEFLPTSEPCAVTTVMAAAAFAAAEALTFLDGGTPDTLGATIEIAAAGRFRRRTWHPHADCGCARIRR
ncbi:MAG TPA: ThiF family adenylyltransferase [Actinoplanes sp.]|nr:ThiF family adenylyltransferase [Actinoplanes sp.]